MSKAIEKIKKIAAREESSWLDEAKERQQNIAWRKRSFQIAARILIEIRRQKPINGMTQKMLAEKLSVAPQYINKVIKGRENLTLETIAKFEEVLGITLINISVPESQDSIFLGVVPKYHEDYNSSKCFYKKLVFRQEEDFNSPQEDGYNIFYAKSNRNKLLDRLPPYPTSDIRENSDLEENYFHYIFKDLWKVEMKGLPPNKQNIPFRIIWSPNESKVSNWEKFMNLRNYEKNEYEHEG